MSKETTHFISSYHDTDKTLAERFITLLEEKYEEIHNNFNFQPGTQKYHFNFCKTVEEYIEKTGKTREEYQSWMVGHSNADTYTISILSPQASEDAAAQSMEKVTVHELVHMIFDTATGVHEDDAEVWLAEGIAILYAEQTDLNYISKTGYPKLAELVGFDNFVDNQGYDYAGIYVKHFIDKFGFEKFVAVYRNECDWQELICDGFEAEAVWAYITWKFACNMFVMHGVTEDPERLLGGWTNQVFAAGNMVLRCTSNVESGRLQREIQLARLLPGEVSYPEIIDSGRTDGYDWMLCRRIPGTNLEDVWEELSWEERASALEQVWMRARQVHVLNTETARPVVNENLWYITTIKNTLGEAELLRKRNIINAGQYEALKRYICCFEETMKGVNRVLVHGDLTPANVMWDAGKIVALMDFECAAIAPKEADLMMLLYTAYEREKWSELQSDFEAKQRFNTRLQALVQEEKPDWDILLGYAVIKLLHHVTMDIDEEDFSIDHVELVNLLGILADGKGLFSAVMLEK